MADLVVPQAPPLVTIPNVELVQTGQWDLSTGRVTFTTGDLAAAIGALTCPAVRRPVLKLGHDEPDPEQRIRWDGEPAVGYVDNMALADSGHTIVGDYAGMPAWLADVAASAYPDRSIEGCFDFRCQIGHTHPFVITAVALLGVQAPGVGTLQSLQDVAALYGVAASSSRTGGEQVAVTIRASRENPMPNPRPAQVAAAVSSEDVRREYYDIAPWEMWIREIQLDPLQLIVCNEDTGSFARVPVVLDGDTVTFAAPIPVRIEYIDLPAEQDGAGTPAAASAGRIVYASRAESRPGNPPAQTPPATARASQETPAAPAAADTPTPEGAGMDPALLRQALGLAPEATDEEVRTALADSGLTDTNDPGTESGDDDGGQTGADTDPAPQDDPPAALAQASRTVPGLPPGFVVINETVLNDLRAAAQDGQAARRQQMAEARDTAVNAAVNEGRIPPASREHFQKLWDADPDGTKTFLASLAPGHVPLADAGVPGGEPDAGADAEFDRLFSQPAKGA